MPRKTTGSAPPPVPAKATGRKAAPVAPSDQKEAPAKAAKAGAGKETGARTVMPAKANAGAPKATAPKTGASLASPAPATKATAKAVSSTKAASTTKPRKAPASTRSGLAPPKGLKAKAEAAGLAPGAAKPRRRAVANAAAAVHGRTVTPWSDDDIFEAFSRFERLNPEPKGELEYHDPFTLLVAVVLSAQATDVGVNKATRGLFAAAPTPKAMFALGEEGVAQFIRTLGLYRGKAKNVVELSRLLLEKHDGVVPPDREALEALPGVGRKTANVVLNIAFGLPTIAVDTHLFRVANRTGLAPGATPLDVELALEKRIPDRFKLHAHHWLILHGRYICKALRPDCPICPINDLCRWPDKPI
ncbi:endonuclease III/Nth precursor [Azorhizobium caulinodans ORS 571]|uniref:Endonuclease III n=2 Tax=Azorhizobium caulinodans TaxID=7 RepID=A8IMZ9_AZOC5|nr:endonuclease III/Nth precursor [Azorhizobium caulinodans ORS 571]